MAKLNTTSMKISVDTSEVDAATVKLKALADQVERLAELGVPIEVILAKLEDWSGGLPKGPGDRS